MPSMDFSLIKPCSYITIAGPALSRYKTGKNTSSIARRIDARGEIQRWGAGADMQDILPANLM